MNLGSPDIKLGIQEIDMGADTFHSLGYIPNYCYHHGIYLFIYLFIHLFIYLQKAV